MKLIQFIVFNCLNVRKRFQNFTNFTLITVLWNSLLCFDITQNVIHSLCLYYLGVTSVTHHKYSIIWITYQGTFYYAVEIFTSTKNSPLKIFLPQKNVHWHYYCGVPSLARVYQVPSLHRLYFSPDNIIMKKHMSQNLHNFIIFEIFLRLLLMYLMFPPHPLFRTACLLYLWSKLY